MAAKDGAMTAEHDGLAPLMRAVDDWVRTGEMTSQSVREKRAAIRLKAEQYGAWQREIAMYTMHDCLANDDEKCTFETDADAARTAYFGEAG